MINTIVWNCRGFGARKTKLHLKEMIRVYKLGILAVMETKVHSSQEIGFLESLGFTYKLVVEAMGFVGGLWLLWDSVIVTIENIFMNTQMITVFVKENVMPTWMLTVVYPSPRATSQEELWEYLEQLGCVVDVPWVVVGDVNQVLDSSDKSGGNQINWTQATKLRKVIDSCSLVDMGFQGSRFTCTSGRQGGANIKELIDQAWCNMQG